MISLQGLSKAVFDNFAHEDKKVNKDTITCNFGTEGELKWEHEHL